MSAKNMTPNDDEQLRQSRQLRIGFIGFGEAASAFAQGWGQSARAAADQDGQVIDAGPVTINKPAGLGPAAIAAYDIKTQASGREQMGKLADYKEAKQKLSQLIEFTGCKTCAAMVGKVDVIFSLVTADQALAAAQSVAASLSAAAQPVADARPVVDAPPGAGAPVYYFDCNSSAPATKIEAAKIVEAAGAHYVDVAIMAPVHPLAHRVPILYAARNPRPVQDIMQRLNLDASVVEGEIGAASAVKMIRSVMIKGLEALTLECVLAGRAAGVDDIVLASLEQTYPGFNWPKRAAFMMERMMCHGRRRAAEMREAGKTLQQLGVSGAMTAGTIQWQQNIGDLELNAEARDYQDLADQINGRLQADRGGK